MSRLMADQESCGGNGDPGAGEEDSVMRVNLAEGCRAVNGETRLVSLVDLSLGLVDCRTDGSETNQIDLSVSPVLRGELCSCGCFSV